MDGWMDGWIENFKCEWMVVTMGVIFFWVPGQFGEVGGMAIIHKRI